VAAIVSGKTRSCHYTARLDSEAAPVVYVCTYYCATDVEISTIAEANGVVNSTPITQRDATAIAANVRRHMARAGLTFEEVVTATELDERTVRGIVRGTKNPHAKTLHKLAGGLGVPIDDLFRPPSQHVAKKFDRATNSRVGSFIADHPQMFCDWSEADFDELYSRFGTGGELTESGIAAAAEATNVKRDMWRQVSVVLESGEAKLLAEFVELLYGRVTLKPADRQLPPAE
jgi:transcriptional regulator with XRE-family HTH domain